MTTTETEPTTTIYTETLTRFLALFTGCRGDVELYVPPRDRGGAPSGHASVFRIPAPSPHLPFELLKWLADGHPLRLMPFTTAGDVAFLFAVFSVKGEQTREPVDAQSVRLYSQPDAEDVARVADGLAQCAVPPAVVIDGGDEVVALYRLSSPLSLEREPARVRDLLGKLAEHVGADTEAVRDVATLSLPIAGRIRNWSALNWTALHFVEPPATYTPDEILTPAAEQLAATGRRRKESRS